MRTSAPAISATVLANGDLRVQTESGPGLSLSASFGFSSSQSDARILVSGAALARSFLAGPFEFIDAPLAHGSRNRVRHTQAQTSAFTAAWADARSQAQAMGFSSMNAFAAAWAKAQTIAQSLGFSSADSYFIPITDGISLPMSAGFNSLSAFTANWSRAFGLVQRLGFTSMGSFLALWESIREQAHVFGFTAEDYYDNAAQFALQSFAQRLGVSSVPEFAAAWEKAQSLDATFGMRMAASFFEEWEGGLDFHIQHDQAFTSNYWTGAPTPGGHGQMGGDTKRAGFGTVRHGRFGGTGHGKFQKKRGDDND